MKTVIQTPEFLKDAASAGLAEDEQQSMVSALGAEPDMGDMMAGTGGCRKVRWPGRGKGKSGGYRTVHYNGSDDVPVLLMLMFGKDEKDNLSQGERNLLRARMQRYEAEYRASVAERIKKMEDALRG
jgi:hypothetical protein